jgi:hypothetical protein
MGAAGVLLAVFSSQTGMAISYVVSAVHLVVAGVLFITHGQVFLSANLHELFPAVSMRVHALLILPLFLLLASMPSMRYLAWTSAAGSITVRIPLFPLPYPPPPPAFG